jgi:putative phosphoesterase
MREAVRRQRSAEVILHLGDGEKEFEYLSAVFPLMELHGVRGNCDVGSQSLTEKLITLDGKRIFMTHGHTYSVKRGLEEIKLRAGELDADIVLFGHTHNAHTEFCGGKHYLNPGSVASSSSGARSFGIVDITPGGVAVFTAPIL